MADQRIQMDYESVEQLANAFAQAAEELDHATAVLNGTLAELPKDVFTGRPANAMSNKWSQKLAPALKKMTALCKEMNNDLRGAVAATRDGDQSGSQRFVG